MSKIAVIMFMCYVVWILCSGWGQNMRGGGGRGGGYGGRGRGAGMGASMMGYGGGGGGGYGGPGAYLSSSPVNYHAVYEQI